MSGLNGKRVLLTGAAGGIGQASAAALKKAGAQVVGIDRRASQVPFPILACNIADEHQVVDAVADAQAQLGGIDVLINNAGILSESPLAKISLAHIERLLSVNVTGTILVTREALPFLHSGARIINIASELAYAGRANVSVYAASKAAVLGLTRSWARELSPILVNAVAPGPTDTPMLDFQNLAPSLQRLETDNPLARIGRPHEIAAAVLFLAGDGSSFFTGQCLGANGGAVMC